MTRKTGNVLANGTHYSRGWSGVVLSPMIAFVASYATGLENVAWQQGELFSLEDATYGSSCSDSLLITMLQVWTQCAAWNLPRHRHQLVDKLTNRCYVPLTHGAHYPLWGIRVLCGAVRT
jgi:hypothetical protein